jgi:hypothetical protein
MAPPWLQARVNDLLQLILFVAGWYFLQRWLLPRLGVPT